MYIARLHFVSYLKDWIDHYIICIYLFDVTVKSGPWNEALQAEISWCFIVKIFKNVAVFNFFVNKPHKVNVFK